MWSISTPWEQTGMILFLGVFLKNQRNNLLVSEKYCMKLFYSW